MENNDNSWIGVDFDGTLAHYEKWGGPHELGAPIWPMVRKVKQLLHSKNKVKIFTARVANGDPENCTESIQNWCLKHIGYALPVTSEKDCGMLYLYDDRAIQVVRNTGETIAQEIYNTLFLIKNNAKFNHSCLEFDDFIFILENVYDIHQEFTDYLITFIWHEINAAIEEITTEHKIQTYIEIIKNLNKILNVTTDNTYFADCKITINNIIKLTQPFFRGLHDRLDQFEVFDQT